MLLLRRWGPEVLLLLLLLLLLLRQVSHVPAQHPQSRDPLDLCV